MLNVSKRVAGFLVLALALTLGDSSPVRSATVWQVPVGGGDLHDLNLVHFAVPGHELRIHAGDTVTWTNRSPRELHTVSFLSGERRLPFLVPGDGGQVSVNPLVLLPSRPEPTYNGEGYFSSGLLEPGQSWSLTFTRVGVYEYASAQYGRMTSRVVVEPPGTPLPVSQADVDADHAVHSARHQAELLWAARGKLTPRAIPAPNGTAEWRIMFGVAIPEAYINRFLPDSLRIREGDTVTWEREGREGGRHTISFLGGEPHPGGLLIAETQGPGRSRPILNGRAVQPTVAAGSLDNTSWDGTGALSSGLIGAEGLFAPTLGGFRALAGRLSWSVTFTRAGTYPYLCLLQPGMRGIIEVRGRDSWPPLDPQLAAIHGEDLVPFASACTTGAAGSSRG